MAAPSSPAGDVRPRGRPLEAQDRDRDGRLHTATFPSRMVVQSGGLRRRHAVPAPRSGPAGARGRGTSAVPAPCSASAREVGRGSAAGESLEPGARASGISSGRAPRGRRGRSAPAPARAWRRGRGPWRRGRGPRAPSGATIAEDRGRVGGRRQAPPLVDPRSARRLRHAPARPGAPRRALPAPRSRCRRVAKAARRRAHTRQRDEARCTSTAAAAPALAAFALSRKETDGDRQSRSRPLSGRARSIDAARTPEGCRCSATSSEIRPTQSPFHARGLDPQVWRSLHLLGSAARRSSSSAAPSSSSASCASGRKEFRRWSPLEVSSSTRCGFGGVFLGQRATSGRGSGGS